MAYSQAFLDKVALKPEYLTEREKAKVFAGPGGWYMKNGNPDAAPELLMTVPGLSQIIDVGTDGTTLLANATEMRAINVGSSRRTRRNFSIYVGLAEELTAIAPLLFTLNIASATVTNSDGAPDANYSGANLTTVVASGEKVGRIRFDFPTLANTAATFNVDLITPNALTVNTVNKLQDTEGNVMLTSDSALIDGQTVTVVG